VSYGHYVREVEANPPHPYSVTIPSNFIHGLEQVYYNGIIISVDPNGEADYTIEGNTIILSNEIQVHESDNISVRYVYPLEEKKEPEEKLEISLVAEIWEDLLVDYSILEKDKYRMKVIGHKVLFESDFKIEVDLNYVHISLDSLTYSTSYIDPFNKKFEFIKYETHQIYIQWLKFHLNKLRELQ